MVVEILLNFLNLKRKIHIPLICMLLIVTLSSQAVAIVNATETTSTPETSSESQTAEEEQETNSGETESQEVESEQESDEETREETTEENDSDESNPEKSDSEQTSVNSISSMSMTTMNMKGEVTGDKVNVRTGPSTSYTSITQLNKGHAVTILAQDSATSWYNIEFVQNNKTITGWMSNTYIRLHVNSDDNPDFEKKLDQQGFPESYRSYLRNLHAQHPNWEFVALHTNLQWNTVVKNQINPVDRSLVPSSSISSWKSLEAGAYNWDKGTWTNFEPGWVAASSEILQYFLDPRNSLVNGGEILQFLSLGWTGKETKEGVNRIIAGTFMAKSNLDYARYFLEAGEKNGVSAYHLASRVVQEVCVGDQPSRSVQGPYYNFFNVNATGTNPVDAGLKYAKDQGWNTPEKSIIGGAKFLTNGYINTGQDTLYLQKFDVVDGGNGYYWHQYMTNIQAPTSEAKNMKKRYTDFDDAHLILRIPVYLNMPSTAATKPTLNGNPNYLLSSLKVNNYSLTPFFNKFTTEYDLIVPEDVSSITIQASPVLSSTKVTGTGTHNLKSGANVIKITSKAQNGKSLVYTINVSRGTVDHDISTDYNIGTYITGVQPGTTVENFKKNIRVDNGTVTVLKADGKAHNGTVGTGNIVQIKQGNTLINQYEVVVYGDTNGDGKISIVDLANVQKHLLKISSIKGIYAEASNTNRGSSGIGIVDLANIQKHILKVSSIRQ